MISVHFDNISVFAIMSGRCRLLLKIDEYTLHGVDQTIGFSTLEAMAKVITHDDRHKV